MASTQLKNTQAYYCIRTKQFDDMHNNKVDTEVGIQKTPCFAGLGMINGMMSSGYNHKILSNNTTDIESQLFGIGSTNLAEIKSKTINPSINTLKKCQFFNLPKVFIPQPLVIEKDQRPSGPFS